MKERIPLPKKTEKIHKDHKKYNRKVNKEISKEISKDEQD
jgi:hypothetical protein